MLKGAVIVLIALAVFAPLGLWIQRNYATCQADPVHTRAIFAVPNECRPEPGERLIYLSGLIFIPACIFLFSQVSSRFQLPNYSHTAWVGHVGVCLLAGGLIWCAAFATGGDKDDAGNGQYHIRFNFLREHPIALALVPLMVAMSVIYLPQKAGASRWYWPLLCAVVLVPWAASVFSDRWFYAGRWHFNAVFDSVVRVHLGKTLLVDSTSQYGLYAWFLAPLFRCVGLSVAKFTFVMGLLSAGSFFMIGLFLWRQVAQPLLAIVGVIATLYNGWMLFLTVEGPHRGSYLDLYFQYVPLRLLFPAILLGLAGCWLIRPTRALGRLIWALLACGILWNLDSGAPTFLAWAMTLLFIETESGRPRGRIVRLVKQFLTAGTAIAGLFAVHALNSYWSAGAWPNYTLLFRSQYIFYAHGFGMLPMPWPGTWMVVIVIYLAGLAFAASAHATGSCDARARAVFLISVLGLMLFSYYQGRSHRAVLILAWWPVFPLLTLLLDGFLERASELRWNMLPAGLVACLPAAILLGSVGSFFENLNRVGDFAGRQLGSVIYPGPVSFEQDAMIVSTFPVRGSALWIISSREAVLHLAAQRSELASCSFNELLLMADYEVLAKQLEEAPDTCIWLDKTELESALSQHQGVQFVANLLARSYEPVAVGEHGWLFRRRQYATRDQAISMSLKACSPVEP